MDQSKWISDISAIRGSNEFARGAKTSAFSDAGEPARPFWLAGRGETTARRGEAANMRCVVAKICWKSRELASP
jgi:hypothetical protein